MDVHEIPGWGVDRDAARRPGVPLQQEFNIDHDTLEGSNAWRETIPLRGLSGMMRRLAYRIPTHKPRRWMMLLMADRVDSIESKLTSKRLLLAAGALGGLVAAVLFARGAKR